MSNLFKKKLLITVFALLTAFFGQAQSECDELKKRITDHKLQSSLIDWVDFNLIDTYELGQEITTTFKVKPGVFSLKNPIFDWQSIGVYDHRSRVVLIGIDYRNLNEEDFTVDAQLISSVYFMLKYNMGVVIKTKTSKEFIDASKKHNLELISDRVALYCSREMRSTD